MGGGRGGGWRHRALVEAGMEAWVWLEAEEVGGGTGRGWRQGGVEALYTYASICEQEDKEGQE